MQIVEIINWACPKEIHKVANENVTKWACGKCKLSGDCIQAKPHTVNSIPTSTHMKSRDASLSDHMSYPHPSPLFCL